MMGNVSYRRKGQAHTAPVGGTQLGTIAEGQTVKVNENGTPVEFYVAKHNYETALNGNGRTLLVRKECYDMRKWHSSNVNAYASSALDSWLNGTYKDLLDANIRGAIGATKIRYTPGNGNYTVGTLNRAIFQLSMTELGQSHSNANVEGSALPIANMLKIVICNGEPSPQWTRSPDKGGSVLFAWLMASTGGIFSEAVSYLRGSRPTFTLPSTTLFDDNMNFMGVA